MFTVTTPAITASNHAREKISSPLSSKRRGFATKLRSLFGVTYQKSCDFGMKRRELKAKEDCSFWSSAKRHKGLLKINDSLKYSFRKWII